MEKFLIGGVRSLRLCRGLQKGLMKLFEKTEKFILFWVVAADVWFCCSESAAVARLGLMLVFTRVGALAAG